MKGPEDDAGLTGKVAIVSGGGAVGDGIGNGRAAAILLARAGTRVLVADLDIKLAERTAGSTSSTTISASAAEAAWSTRSPRNIAGSCRSTSRRCSCSPSTPSRP